uniref:Secreted protein n=1 Tax=Panagrolaimus sp. JU765 TaxID=591449 RepID=A0AC34QS32_9BILA
MFFLFVLSSFYVFVTKRAGREAATGQNALIERKFSSRTLCFLCHSTLKVKIISRYSRSTAAIFGFVQTFGH